MSDTRENFSIGDNVFVRNPQRFVPDCTCIVGPIKSIGETCVIAASVGRGAENGGCFEAEIEVPISEIGHRIGTPISQLSGRSGHPGYAEFVRIAKSWGYP
jgi:hypothetical protein